MEAIKKIGKYAYKLYAYKKKCVSYKREVYCERTG